MIYYFVFDKYPFGKELDIVVENKAVKRRIVKIVRLQKRWTKN